MQVKSFTYEKSWYGTYYRQRFFSMERMDKHIAKMLSQGWKILTQTATQEKEEASDRLLNAIPSRSRFRDRDP